MELCAPSTIYEVGYREVNVDEEDTSKFSNDKFEDTVVAIWAKAVDTQMHFNEMSVKSRQLGLTFVAAALGLAVFLFSRSGADAKFAFSASIMGHQFVFHVAEFIILAAAASVYAVKLLDLGVYHKMLRGAVAFGEDLEEVHIRRMLGLNKGMTQAISHFSRHSDAKTSVSEGKTVYSGTDHKNAGQKINNFYWVVILSLIACAALMFAIGNDLL
jgi:hypothetical protein